MQVKANQDGSLPAAASSQPLPCFNLLSIAAPFLGGLAVLAFLGIVGASGHWYWTWRGGAALGILAGSCVIGFLFACIAWIRSERLWGLTVLGWLLNAPLPLLLLHAALMNLDAWLRYG